MTTYKRRMSLKTMRKTTAGTNHTPDADKLAALVDQIADVDLRNVVGCVVWWDTLGALPTSGTRHQSFAGYLDGWRASYIAPVDAVRRELIRLGYAPEDAAKKAARTIPAPKVEPTRGGHYE